MRLSPRILLTAAALGLPVAGVSYSHPTWTSDLGLDFWSVPELQDRIARQRRHRVMLDVEDEIVLRRIARKEALVQELLAGRMGLLETAAWFRELNAERPDYLPMIRNAFPGSTDDERYCRNVIYYAQSYLNASGASDSAAVERLHAELARCSARGGVTLPAVPTSPERPAADVR